MTVFLVHHADAVGPDVDSQRPLSERGREHATNLSREARRLGIAPAAIWHSGKLRARQTGEAFLLECCPFATFRMVRGLAPGDGVEWIADAIEAEDNDVMVVGHMPHLPELARRLSPEGDPFPLHGLVGFERIGERRYVECVRVAGVGLQ